MMNALSFPWIALLGMAPAPKSLAELPAWMYVGGASVLLLLIVLILKLQSLPSTLRARNKSTLDPTQLEELMIGTPPQIVDLRPETEYLGEKGHIRGAVNIPFSEFQKRVDELDTSHPRPIVLVDESDVLSHQLMPVLEARGHRWIYVLKGGFKAWRRAKYPVYSTRSDLKKK
jgi:3-mercaptopyruvate sulfurtransferase SseA